MRRELPANYTVCFAEDEIRTQVAKIAADIGHWAQTVESDSGQQVLAVCVLRGGAFFFTDLLRALPCSVEAAYCRTWGYSTDTNTLAPTGVRVAVDDLFVSGRSVLVVDDICETGSTLKKLENVLLELGAREVRSAVLIRRQVPNAKYQLAWFVFDYPGAEWFVGYGMDDRNRYANLPAVYTVSPS